MSERRRLPQRRRSETYDIDYRGLKKLHTVTLGYYDDGRIGEVFISAGQSGDVIEAMARDTAVIISIALQLGANIVDIKAALTRDDQDQATSIIAVVVDSMVARQCRDH